jgi:hypothetical protein
LHDSSSVKQEQNKAGMAKKKQDNISHYTLLNIVLSEQDKTQEQHDICDMSQTQCMARARQNTRAA